MFVPFLRLYCPLITSQEPAPSKKGSVNVKGGKQYGGPGSFVPAGESGIDGPRTLSRESSASTVPGEIYRNPIPVPPSLRSSHSVAKLDLYVPPYESIRSHNSADNVTSEFAEMTIGNTATRRQSLPVCARTLCGCQSDVYSTVTAKPLSC